MTVSDLRACQCFNDDSIPDECQKKTSKSVEDAVIISDNMISS